ncbi:unnamed protein product [Sphenostylis stenocarpa]|uniref:Uncharacterized protein n=1 Tax=Sphenostylis stenocarpa TaxID=92480 RepID=A0AA86VBT4_9FABA|nr:unnamed protein product [Sphenostylis stenocarpa]
MMDKPKSLINKSLQKEKEIAVHPLRLRKPSVTPSNATGLYTLPLLQPSFKFLAISHPNSTKSLRGAFSKMKETKRLEPSSKVRNMNNYKLQEIPKSDRVKEEGFKCSALCMPLPGFGKTKPVKARKEETQMHAVNSMVSSSKPNSWQNFERSSLVSQARIHETEEDNSISSYFDLPSELFKFSSHNA